MEGALIFGSVAAAAYIRFGGDLYRFSSYEYLLLKALLVSIICQVCLYYNDLYDFKVVTNNLELAIRLLQAIGSAYLILACISYLGVIFVFRQPYTISFYLAAFIVVGIELAAFTILQAGLMVKPIVAYALALMTVSVIHALVFLYNFIFISLPDLNYIIGEWLFWLAWTLFSVPLIRNVLTHSNRGSHYIK